MDHADGDLPLGDGLEVQLDDRRSVGRVVAGERRDVEHLLAPGLVGVVIGDAGGEVLDEGEAAPGAVELDRLGEHAPIIRGSPEKVRATNVGTS